MSLTTGLNEDLQFLVDLFLVDYEGNELTLDSTITALPNGTIVFYLINKETQKRYRVSYNIEDE